MRGVTAVVVSLGLALSSLVPAARAAEAPPAPPPAEEVAPPAPVPAATTPAAAAVTPAASAPRAPVGKTFAPLPTPTMSHFLQFGVAVLPGGGYRGIFPYQEMIDCGQLGKRVCTARLPFFLDVQPSFGFANHWDVLVDLRFGLEKDFTHAHQVAVVPGVRYWVDPQDQAKFFATVQVAYDTTAQHNAQLHNNDVALRNSNGFMYDFMRNFGAYVEFGETIGVLRWLRFEIDAGVGIQARLP